MFISTLHLQSISVVFKTTARFFPHRDSELVSLGIFFHMKCSFKQSTEQKQHVEKKKHQQKTDQTKQSHQQKHIDNDNNTEHSMNAEPSLARTQFNMTQFLGKSKCHNITATQVYLESLFKIYLLEFTMTV